MESLHPAGISRPKCESTTSFQVSRTSLDDHRSQSPTFHHLLFAREGGQAQQNSHRSLWCWTPEILSLLLGFVCLTVIIIVLAYADGRTAPIWTLGVTLNTFLAFFTSLAKVAFMLPVVEGLGQLKWMWFVTNKPKPLIDFQVFDDASRGAWGCLWLLVQFKGFLSCLAALITLSSLLTSTVTQQAIEFETKRALLSNGTATVNRATVMSLYDGNGLAIGPYDTVHEKQALVEGAFTAPNETMPHIAPTCPSGDCTWDVYGTLAICTDVVNLTAAGNETFLDSLRQSTVTRLHEVFNASQAPGSLEYGTIPLPSLPPVFPVLVSPVSGPTGLFNKSISELIITDHIIAYTNALTNDTSIDPSQFQFLEVVSNMCTKSLSTLVIDGIPNTTEVASHSQAKSTVNHSINFAWSSDFMACYALNTCNDTFGGMTVELEPPPGLASNESYLVDVWTALAASALVDEAMYDAVLVDETRGFVATNGGGMAQAFAIAMYGDFMNTQDLPQATQMSNVQGLARKLAISLTNVARESDTRYRLGGDATAVAQGTVYTPQTFVKVHWPYIAMLAVQLFLATVFLVATIASARSSRLQILKSSPLATLCGLDKETRSQLGGINDFKAVNDRAKTVGVKLERGSSGVALWLGMKRSRPTTWQPVPSWRDVRGDDGDQDIPLVGTHSH